MKTDQIRSAFLEFFASKGHKIFPSDSLVPSDDPTVLFTSAGMNQFKPYFLGLKKDLSRAASCQKCLRTDDLEKVGRTASHHTFFEMLGNFSFGDYFKEEAISWAWEFVSQVLRLPVQKIWVSVYQDDQEAYDIWTRKIALPQEKLVRLGQDKNFWPANAIENGPDGPCGPCSEIFYDLGENVGCRRAECNPGCDCGRFVEVWNLVFTQYNRRQEAEKGILEPLPTKNIDTGMGLERLASLLQGVRSNFEIDIFKPIVKEILLLSGRKEVELFHLYAIADHARAITFAISDGVFPSNEERGYVVRKLIRKAVWHAYKIGLEKLFLYKLIPLVASCMKSAYPELEQRREKIARIVKAEEERFQNTLEVGLARLDQLLQELKKSNQNFLSGEKAFQLYDTYGIPYELTRELAQENGFEVDEKGFQLALKAQKEKSRVRSQLKEEIFSREKELLKNLPETDFVGYHSLSIESQIVGIYNKELSSKLPQLSPGEDGVLLLLSSPFYGEAGGQVGDKGQILGDTARAEVWDTQIRDRRILHFVKVKKGSFKPNQKVILEVDEERRLDIARNHTATHILQAALRKVLGEHVEQSGSYVGPERLRFDFTHFKALSRDEVKWVEEMVNSYIMQNDEVKTRVVPYELARKEGALAFFAQKYEEMVRVVEIGNYSRELCAGTHLKSTGQIGLFKIISESSSASGVRRIEAITGRKAFSWIKAQEELLDEISFQLKTDREREKILTQIKQLQRTLREQEKLIRKQSLAQLDGYLLNLIQSQQVIKGVNFIHSRLDEDGEFLAALIDKIKEKAGQNTAIVLYSFKKGKLLLLIGLTSDLVKRGLDARVLIKNIAGIIKGGGGGRPDFVQAGGKEISNIGEALERIKNDIQDGLK